MADALHVCGIVYTLLNRCDEALVHLDADLVAASGALTNHLNLAWQAVACSRAGRWAEAIAALDRSLNLNPDYPVVLTTKSIMCRRGGQADEARDLLARARQLQPSMTLALWETCLSRWHARSPYLNEVIAELRALWADAESRTAQRCLDARPSSDLGATDN